MKANMVIAFVTISPLLMMACPPQPNASSKMVTDEPAVVIIPLLGSTRDVRGVDLPPSLHGPGVGGFDFLELCELTILVPGRRSIRLHARSLTITAMDGIVTFVTIRQPIEPLRRFKELVADLLRTLKEQGIDPDKGMEQDLEKWPADPQISGHLVPVAFASTAIHTAFGELGSVDIKIYPGNEGRVVLSPGNRDAASKPVTRPRSSIRATRSRWTFVPAARKRDFSTGASRKRRIVASRCMVPRFACRARPGRWPESSSRRTFWPASPLYGQSRTATRHDHPAHRTPGHSRSWLANPRCPFATETCKASHWSGRSSPAISRRRSPILPRPSRPRTLTRPQSRT